MKLMKCFVLFSLFSLILTGCGRQTLKCEKSSKINAGSVIEKQSISFVNDKIDKYETSFNIKISDDYKELSENFYEYLKSYFKNYENQKGVKFKFQNNDNNFFISISGIYDEMSSKVKEDLGLSKNMSLESVLNFLKDEGYKCEH